MSISINPGAGPVERGSEEMAWLNVQRLAVDVAERYPQTSVRLIEVTGEEDGRWVFSVTLQRPGKILNLDVEMPGWPLAEVRWMKGEGQNIWNFPRLYVDGSSWVWYYAIDALGSHPFEEN